MNILIAPDSFKESLSALQAAEAIAAGFALGWPQAHCRCLPMADGGEGTAQTLLDACGGRWRSCTVRDPLNRPVRAKYALLADGQAVIEMAEAAGLHLVPVQQRDPCMTTTYGVGELLADALEQGCQEVIMAIGGSATNDAGTGLLSALGWRFYDRAGQVLPPGGAALRDLAQIDDTGKHPGLAQCRITVACDVDNPLCGDRGATAVFAPQKGANPAQAALLEQALKRFAQVRAAALGRDDSHKAGAGAAGGLGFALSSFLGAHLQPGVALVAQAVGLEHAVAQADWVITGEGRLDGQTAGGKVPYGVLQCAKPYQVPVIAVAGVLGAGIVDKYRNDLGFSAVFPCIGELDTAENTLKNGAFNLTRLAANLAALLQIAGSRADRKATGNP